MTTPAASGDVLAGAVKTAPQQIWVGAITDPSGYTDELRGFLRAIERCGYEPALRERNWNLDVTAGLSAADRALFDRQGQRGGDGPAVAIHQGLPNWWQPYVVSVPNVQRCMFETDTLPGSWRAPIRDRDEVWVPSEFNVETFARGGVPEERLKVLGGTLDFDLFTPGTVAPLDLGAPAGHFTFLTNFDFSERKGWRQLIRAWARAFAPTDPVCLMLKTGSLFQDDEEVRARIGAFIAGEFGSTDRLAPVHVLCDRLSAEQMPALYAGADAYVLASRGEGWGRPYMEALAMGLPTIASNWSGNLAFMEPETSWLVDGEVVPVADQDMNNDLYAGHGWFEPDVDELVAALQQVAGDPDAARAKAAPARADLIRRFGPEATAHRVAELATAAHERYGDLRAQPVSVVVHGALDDTLASALEADGSNVQRRFGDAETSFKAPAIVHGAPPSLDPRSAGATVAVAGGVVDDAWIDEAKSRADRVWVDDDSLRDALVARGLAPGVVQTIADPEAARESLSVLAAEGLPLARDLRRAEIEARSRFVVFAPDWDDPHAWQPGLDAWLDNFTGADDITLALYVDGDADAIGGRIMAHLGGRDESALPDLALVVPSSVSLTALAASADAVLSATPDPASRPELLRRARRVVDPSAVAEELKEVL